MGKILSCSNDMKHEYCCVIVKVGEVIPIEGSDFLGKTIIEGFSIVVRKDEVKEGDIMIYAENETELNEEFLSINNLYESAEYERNSNNKEYAELVFNGKKDEAKRLCGFFNKYGRVKMIRLKGTPSFGVLFSKDAIVKWKPEFKDINLEDYVGQDFDTVCGELFVKAYIPRIKEYPIREGRGAKRNRKAQKRIDKLEKMIPGEFTFHYETAQLERNAFKLNPKDTVSISVKVHGTSAIFANVKTRLPLITLPKWKKFINKLYFNFGWKKPFIDFYVDYNPLFASRRVVRNNNIMEKKIDNYYDVDVYNEYGQLLAPYIGKGVTVYGEIAGWVNNEKMIQKNYDYGCKRNTNFFMPYRITTNLENGEKYEWEINEVIEWTKNVIKINPSLSERIRPLYLLYHGTLKELYPDLDVNNHWQENLLEKMKNDKEHFGMEEIEPLCTNFKVPREGVCVRIDNDPTSECFKLKCIKFKEHEMKAIDKGEVDSEMEEGYEEA